MRRVGGRRGSWRREGEGDGEGEGVRYLGV